MPTLFLEITAQFGWWGWSIIVLGAVATAAIHGAVGLAGGFLMSALLVPFIGVKAVVPVMSIALFISHVSRAALNFSDFDRTVFLNILAPALPCLVLVGWFYGAMSSSLIAGVIGTVILVSIPMRHFAHRIGLVVTRTGLRTAGAVYGALSGASLGAGGLLVPVMLGYGLSKEAFVATLAAIAIIINFLRVGTYGVSGVMELDMVFLGLVIGVLTVPGNWMGRTLLRSMTRRNHSLLVDLLTALGAANFLRLAVFGEE